jgi:protein-histidine pros-kinase
MPISGPEDRRQDAWLAAIVAASNDAILSCTIEGTILTWNPSAERTFGYTPEEAVGQPYTTIVAPECLADLSACCARLRAGETVRDLEGLGVRRDGTRVPIMLSLAPIQEHGTVTGISITVCDLGERKRAEDRFRGLLESAPDPIFGVNEAGRIVFANRRTEEVFGYAPTELVGRTIEVLVPERHRERHRRYRDDYARAPLTRPMGTGLALRARRRDGTEVPVEISLSPLTERDGRLTVAIVRDISERMRIEDERARERGEVDRLKDDLASMIVHDLKNPVNGIVMTVQAMLRRGGEVTERQRRSLRNIERTCREMLRLTHNLLEIAKIEAGQMPIEHEAVDLPQVVHAVAEEYGPVAEELGKRFVVALGAGLPIVLADATLLKRVLVNLVVNAIRHSGATEVRVEADPLPGAREIRLCVRDNGRGIPEEDRTRIFEKFGSVRRTASGEPSADTGLGLPFCKLAVERMGGRLELVADAGSRTVFAVTLGVHAGE